MQSEAVVTAQSDWLVSLPLTQRVLFLAALGHALTITARDTYIPQTEELSKPWQLRRINEVQHRVLACQYELMTGQGSESFLRSIAQWTLDHPERDLQGLMGWAWREAKERVATAK